VCVCVCVCVCVFVCVCECAFYRVLVYPSDFIEHIILWHS
jgi:hypothetical protein